jgi:hypothetical protein
MMPMFASCGLVSRTYGVRDHERQEQPNGRDQVNVRVFEQAITALQEQLTVANERAERLIEEERGRVNEERWRVDWLHM